jgi:hypothetical protein
VKRTYVDSGVLVWASRGAGEFAERALAILEDPERAFVSSVFVELETLPKPAHHRRRTELEFYEAFFASCEASVRASAALADAALAEATRHGLAGMDALHVVSAASADADEFVTTEKPTKPLHRTRRVHVVSLRPA